MGVSLKDIPDAELTPEEVEAIANKTFDYADKNNVTMRAARSAIRKETHDETIRRSLVESNKVFGTNFDTTNPNWNPGTIGPGFGDFTFGEKTLEVLKAGHRGLGSIVKIPGVALKAIGEIPLNRAQRERMKKSSFAPARHFGNIADSPATKPLRQTADILRRAGNKYIDIANSMALKESPESRMVRSQPFSGAPIFRTASAIAESAPSYAVAVAATLTSGNPNIGLYVLGSTTASSSYENLRADGVEPNLALIGATVEGSIEMLTEKVPMDILMAGAGRKFLVRALKLGTAESFQELFANLGQNYVSAVVKDVDPENYASAFKAANQEWDIISRGWQDSMAAGFFMGGGAAAFNGGQAPAEFKFKSQEQMRAEYGVAPRNMNELLYMTEQVRNQVKAIEKAESDLVDGVPRVPDSQTPVAPDVVVQEGKLTDPIVEPTVEGTAQTAAPLTPEEQQSVDLLVSKGETVEEAERLSRLSSKEFPEAQKEADALLESAQKLEEIGEGELKPRGTSVSVLAQAIEAEMVAENEDLEGQLPVYRAMSMSDQAQKAETIILNDIEQAKRIAFFQEPAPPGVYPENIFTGLRVFAKSTVDVDLLRELALNEVAAREHTILGKRIKSLDTDQDHADPVSAIKGVVEARAEKAIRDGENTTAIEVELDALRAELETSKKALAEYTKQAKKAYGEKNTVVTKTVYDEIIARRQQEISQMRHGRNMGAAYVPTAQDFIDLAKIGTFHVEALGRDFTAWSAKVTNDLGEWVTPHLKGQYDKSVAEAGDATPERKQATEEKRIETATKAVEKSIATLEKKIETGDTSVKKKKTVSTPELDALRKKRDGLRKELQQLRNAEKPKKSPEQKRLDAKKSRLKTGAKKFDAKLGSKDFGKAERAVIELDAEGQELQDAYDLAKRKFKAAQAAAGIITDEEIQIIAELANDVDSRKVKMEKGKRRINAKQEAPSKVEMDYGTALGVFNEYVGGLKAQANKLTLTQKAKDYLNDPKTILTDTFGVMKNLRATWDNSFIGRQGRKTFLKGITGDMESAKIWWKTFFRSFKVMWDTLKGKNVRLALFAEIVSDPDYDLLKQSGVAINVLIEEETATDILEKIPYLGMTFRVSDNAFIESSRYMRYKLAKQYIDIWRKSGRIIDKKQAISLGKLANSQTGRGEGASTGLLNNVFWSPGNLRASIDTLTLHLFDKNFSAFARKQAALNLMRYISGAAMILALADWIDDDSVTWDSNSSDFGKIKIGKTRFSVGGGLEILIVLASRLVSRNFTSATSGRKRDIDAGSFTQTGGKDLVFNFFENKFSPGLAMALSIIDQKTRDGNSLTIPQMAADGLSPLIIQQVMESGNSEDASNVLAVLIAEALGVNVQTFKDREKKSNKRSKF